jgi:adenylate cyclase
VGTEIDTTSDEATEPRSARSVKDELASAPSSSFGIGAKLISAFAALAGLTAVAGAVAWYVFGTVDHSVMRLTNESIPSIATSLRLAEKSAEIAAAAPSIIASAKQEERVLEEAKLKQRAGDLMNLIEGLKVIGLPNRKIATLERIVEEMTAELTQLDTYVEKRLATRTKKDAAVAGLAATHAKFLELIEPFVDDRVFDLLIQGEETTAKTSHVITDLVEGGTSDILRLLTMYAEINLAAGLLAQTAQTSDFNLIEPAREKFEAAAAAVKRTLRQLPDTRDNEELSILTQAFIALGAGKRNLFDVRLRELKSIAAERESLEAERKRLSGAIKTAHETLLLRLIPMVDDGAFDLILTSETVSAESAKSITDLIDLGVSTVRILLSVRAESNLVAGLLSEAAGAQDATRLQPLSERFVAAAARIDRLIKQLSDEQMKNVARSATDDIVNYGKGTGSIFALRRDELSQIAAADRSLRRNRSLAARLGEEVANLVKTVKQNSDIAAARSADAIGDGRLVLIIVSAASILGAMLIALFYVRPRIVWPLENVTDAMIELASGDTTVDIPGRDRRDEMGRMAHALGVFRDTAIEVQKSNLREIRETRRRLFDAIETISEGFSLYDNEDRLVVFNSKYRELLYPNSDLDIDPGMTFESIIRRAAEEGYIKEAEDRVDQWVEQRMVRHRNPGDPHIHERADGQWIMVSERRTQDGGAVAVYSDITELKQREQELAEKSHTMENLSNQLAKYLSPQVYDSIFAGKKEVKVASHRQKLTVFFSDIAGFTETAERLESEDLTHLLNHYLTEMSQIALRHGATIDKYVGDAIVIFFGDPETRGVQADALACVEMAIAMRSRMAELEKDWRASGVENPLKCRMGINTGYCTVGNFGSADRMDYTIIGSGVNLASRLEGAAEPGSILISYETYANVKDKIHCESRGEIKVKGMAYPVATYEVIDAKEGPGLEQEVIRENHRNFKLDVQLEALSIAEIEQTAKILRHALDRVNEIGKWTKSRSRSKKRGTTRRSADKTS